VANKRINDAGLDDQTAENVCRARLFLADHSAIERDRRGIIGELAQRINEFAWRISELAAGDERLRLANF